jgi:hypothetical protein
MIPMEVLNGMKGKSVRTPASGRRWACWPVLALLAGCGTTEFEARPTIPAPLVEKIPVVIGVYMAPEFREKVYREEREGADVAIALGKAQTEGFMRLLDAMFLRVVPVTSTDAGASTDPAIRGVLEPVLEDVAFVTPTDSGADVYAVSLKYRVSGYKPDGQFTDSWTFTGYGAAAVSNMLGIGTDALQKATQLAMRDAGARLATELREQAIVRGLLSADSKAPVPEETPAPP